MIKKFKSLIAKIIHIIKFRENYIPLITVEISRLAIIHNLRQLQKLAPAWQIAPVLKSNAYGHGIELVASILSEEKGVPFFCNDSYYEAIVLRRAGIDKTLLIMGRTETEIIIKNKLNDVHFSIGSLEALKDFVWQKCRQPIQIKFDTGMHRQGIEWNKTDEVIKLLKDNKSIQVVGIFSHLAESEASDSEITRKQIERWNVLSEKLHREFPSIAYFHLANSGGFSIANNIKANVGRAGLALYGIGLGSLNFGLKPALSMKSTIGHIRTIESGESVGYNGTFIAKNQAIIATIPAGYFEGIDRRLSNKGFFLVDNKAVPIIGRVSMNITSCDITNVAEAKENMPAVLISNDPDHLNSVANIARLCDTIPYEILVHIPQHLRRTEVV